MVLGIAVAGAVVVGAIALAKSGTLPAPIAAIMPIDESIQEWEHGFKTSQVTATRRTNKEKASWTIQLDFADQYNADRAEIGDFLHAFDCGIFQGGGYPGAPAMVACKTIKSKEDATAKIKEFLPGLTRMMAEMSIRNKIDVNEYLSDEQRKKLAADLEAHKWPNATEADVGSGFSDGVNQYTAKEVSPGKWEWVVMKF